jgi:ADP-heptose:LPS heptosyltransferase
MESGTVTLQPVPADSSIRRLLIFRPDNLGDVVLFSGALRPIREAWPHAHITVAVQKDVLSYLELCPYIDSLSVLGNGSDFRHNSWLKGIVREFNGIIGGRLRDLVFSTHMKRIHLTVSKVLCGMMLRPSRYDAILFPVRSPKWQHHVSIGSRSARLKVGVSGDTSNQTFFEDRVAETIYTARYKLKQDRLGDPELEVTRDFLRFLGIRVSLADIQPTTWTDDSDVGIARRLMPNAECLRLGISLGASWWGKIFPVDGIVTVISSIANHRLSCCIFGIEKEMDLCAELHSKLSLCSNVSEVVNLCGKTTIRTLTECLRLCDVVLASDAAPLHLATAIGKPTVGIRGGAHYGRFYPWGNPKINRVASHLTPCHGCNWICSSEGIPCISDIPPATIARELQILLDDLRDQGSSGVNRVAYL